MNSCKGCFYNLGDTCQVMRHKQTGGCYAYATMEEAIQREKDIEAYKEYCYGTMIKTGTPRQKLDAEFTKLYDLGLRDIEIGKRLQISPSTVGCYRRDLGLPTNKKMPAGTGK